MLTLLCEVKSLLTKYTVIAVELQHIFPNMLLLTVTSSQFAMECRVDTASRCGTGPQYAGILGFSYAQVCFHLFCQLPVLLSGLVMFIYWDITEVK